jgi:hypothetical protein
MRRRIRRRLVLWFVLFLLAPAARSGDEIPKAAWQRAIGRPLATAGTKKPTLDHDHIDDGFW